MFHKILVIMRKSRNIIVFNSLTSKHVYFAYVWSILFSRAIETAFPSYKNNGAVGEPIAIINAC